MRKLQDFIVLLHLSIRYLIWCTTRYTIRWTRVPRNVARCTKFWGAQCSPELALRSTDFRAPKNLIFPALEISLKNELWCRHMASSFLCIWSFLNTLFSWTRLLPDIWVDGIPFFQTDLKYWSNYWQRKENFYLKNLLYPLKISGNHRFSDVFRGYRSGTLV